MSVYNFQQGMMAGAAAAGGYTIDQSIRFNDDDSAHLYRDQSAGDKRKATFSFWMKLGALLSFQQIWTVRDNATNPGDAFKLFLQSDTLRVQNMSGASVDWLVVTSQLFRDPSAWYHVVLSVDTDQATDTNRVKVYVNGTQASFSSASYPTVNADQDFGSAFRQWIGVNRTDAGGLNGYFDGYLAEINFIDGTALDATSFGETNSDGVWVPKAYTGSYGTNGFYITGENSADLGADYSGNGNDFTSSGLTAADQVTDTPTNVFNSFSGINISSLTTLSEGALKAVGSGTEVSGVWSNMPITSGQVIYLEGTWGSTSAWGYFGVSSKTNHDEVTVTFNSDASTHIFQLTPTAGNRGVASAGSTLFTGKTAWTSTDTYQIAIDIDNGKLWFGVNDSWYDSGGTTTGDPAAGTNPTVTFTAGTPMFVVAQSGGSSSINVNFGQDSTNVSTGNADGNGYGNFEYAPPSGFLSFCSANLPAPTVTDPSAYFQSVLYTGNGTAIGSGGKAVTGVGFQPDFVWIKNRSAADNHMLYDAVRGATKDLHSNTTDAEATDTEGLSTFDADGFTVGSNVAVNTNTENYVAWCWKANGSGSSNTDGSITSTVSVNQTAGFSIVTYTGDGNDNATVGHGLGITPKTVVIFPRSSGDNRQVSNWEAGVTPFTEDLKINAAEVANSSSARVKGGSSTTFTLGTDSNVNGSGNTYVAYVWNEVAGFSKFATYTSNGSTDGPFVYCGFRPAVVFIRCTENGENWHVYDSTRNEYNATNLFLYPTTLDSEQSSGRDIDILSNGFKLRGTDGGINSASNRKYIAMCFAEHPLGGGSVAPTTAR